MESIATFSIRMEKGRLGFSKKYCYSSINVMARNRFGIDVVLSISFTALKAMLKKAVLLVNLLLIYIESTRILKWPN